MRDRHADVASLGYCDELSAVIITLMTTFATMKVVPHIAAAAAFFIKFCISAAVLHLTMQLIKGSMVYQSVATARHMA